MPRPRRICVPGLPHHVVQRGNNRQITFHAKEDYAAYLAILAKAAKKHDVSIHAYTLMTNHVHLLLTPTASDGLSLIMQTIGRSYVTYINKRYRRSGTLWEGRFKSSVVDSDRYCLACYRYIELNPLRAGLVSEVSDYRWCSYPGNGLARADRLLTPHTLYLQLGATPRIRADRYRVMIGEGVDEDVCQKIRFGTRKGLPVGGDRFRAKIEHYLGRRLGHERVGRPTKH